MHHNFLLFSFTGGMLNTSINTSKAGYKEIPLAAIAANVSP
jgi:hypothetical protein